MNAFYDVIVVTLVTSESQKKTVFGVIFIFRFFQFIFTIVHRRKIASMIPMKMELNIYDNKRNYCTSPKEPAPAITMVRASERGKFVC